MSTGYKAQSGRSPFWTQTERPSLCQKMFMLRDHAWYRNRRRLPYVRTDLKVLRDILNHPSITKKVREDSITKDTVAYDAVTLYFLPLREIEVAASYLNEWLNAVCDTYGIERFCPTAELCKQLSDAYQQIGPSVSVWTTPKPI
jgi:hypothetical protein